MVYGYAELPSIMEKIMNDLKPFLTWTNCWLFMPNTISPTTKGTYSPIEWIDTNWHPTDREVIIGYLTSCPVHSYGFTPPVQCCLCGEELDSPSMWRWDGVWLWPHLLNHFI